MLAVKASARGRGAGHRPRRLGLGPDAVRRAVRGRRAQQPPARGRERRARGGRAHPARALAAVGDRGGDLATSSTRSRAHRPRPGLRRRSRGAGAAAPVEQSARASSCSTRGIPLLDPRGGRADRPRRSARLRAVVISGPNTGGKTVALKTLGLAALLHQCGPAAAGASAPSCRCSTSVLADIGDEQSIAMSLSTFSGHLRNLLAILERPPSARSCCSTSSPPAPTRSRARRSPGRCSSGSPAQARLSVATTPLRRAEGVGQRARRPRANARDRLRPRRRRSRSTASRSAGPGPSTRCRSPERLGLDRERGRAMRARTSRPERLRVDGAARRGRGRRAATPSASARPGNAARPRRRAAAEAARVSTSWRREIETRARRRGGRAGARAAQQAERRAGRVRRRARRAARRDPRRAARERERRRSGDAAAARRSASATAGSAPPTERIRGAERALARRRTRRRR